MERLDLDNLNRLSTLIRTIGANPGISPQALKSLLKKKGTDVSERTLYTDLGFLRNELSLLPRQGRMRDGYFLDGFLTLSGSEINSVLNALETFSIDLQDQDFTKLVKTIRRRTVANMGNAAISARQTKSIAHRVATKNSNHDVVKLINSAVNNSTLCKMCYVSPRNDLPSQFTNYILLTVFYERAWYAIVKDADSGNYFPCRFDRIESLNLETKAPRLEASDGHITEARFLMSNGWGMTFPKNRDELLRVNDLPETIVRFEHSIAEYILETASRHPKGHAEHLRDGTGDVLFKIRLHDIWEFRHWVRQFGSLAWFVAPENVVNQERTDILKLASRYSLKPFADRSK